MRGRARCAFSLELKEFLDVVVKDSTWGHDFFVSHCFSLEFLTVVVFAKNAPRLENRCRPSERALEPLFRKKPEPGSKERDG